MIKHSIKVGFSFGVMSGVITTLGLMVGLNAGTQSKSAVLGGIIVIAVADAFSDALGINNILNITENTLFSKFKPIHLDQPETKKYLIFI